MAAAQGFVVLVRALPNQAAHAVFQSTLYERSNRRGACARRDTLLGVCQGLRKLLYGLVIKVGVVKKQDLVK
jgi:hypothetical protein